MASIWTKKQVVLLPGLIHPSQINNKDVIQTALDEAEEMATGIASARLVVIEECGHMTLLEKRAETSAALRRWLTQ
jgi:pimeloyl-ACP methyl ester carboxylesterase